MVMRIATFNILHGRTVGEGVHPATKPHVQAYARAPGQPPTTPYHALANEADASLRLRALVRVLEAKGILAEGELEAAVIDLMRTGRDVPDEGDR